MRTNNIELKIAILFIAPLFTNGQPAAATQHDEQVCCTPGCPPAGADCQQVQDKCENCGHFARIAKVNALIKLPPPQSTCIPFPTFLPADKLPDDLFTRLENWSSRIGRNSDGHMVMECTIENMEGMADRDKEARIMRISIRHSKLSPPCEPRYRFEINPDPNKTHLLNSEGRHLKVVTEGAEVVVGDGEFSSKQDQQPNSTPAAEIIIRPTQPPCGDYPEGYTIQGNTIRVPTDYTELHFEVILRKWKNAPVGGSQPADSQ